MAHLSFAISEFGLHLVHFTFGLGDLARHCCHTFGTDLLAVAGLFLLPFGLELIFNLSLFRLEDKAESILKLLYFCLKRRLPRGHLIFKLGTFFVLLALQLPLHSVSGILQVAIVLITVHFNVFPRFLFHLPFFLPHSVVDLQLGIEFGFINAFALGSPSKPILFTLQPRLDISFDTFLSISKSALIIRLDLLNCIFECIFSCFLVLLLLLVQIDF